MLREFMSNIKAMSALVVLTSFLLVYFLIPKISWVLKMRNVHDHPDERSSHGSAVPSMAGFAFFITLIMTFFFIQGFDTDLLSLHIIAGITTIFITGLKDDLVLVTPRSKIMMQLIAISFILFCSGFQVTSLHGFLGMYTLPPALSYIGLALMLLTIINAYNLIDGIDGLAASVAIVVFSIYTLIFFATGLYFYVLFCLSLIGILLAYLTYNFSSTKKIFMGDTGSLIIGFCIGICTLKFFAMDVAQFSRFSFKAENKLIVIAAILGIPLFDLFRVMLVRRYLKKSLFFPDRNHLHHILIDSGLSHFTASMLLGFSNYILVILIIWLSSHWNSFVMITLLFILFIATFLVCHLLKKQIPSKT